MVSSNHQAKAPISSHPAFPAIVCLWFAALLGIGSLIVPAQLFEQLFALAGLPEVLAAAGPPLGFTARLMIAAASTVAGAITGLLLARKVAAAAAPATPNSGKEFFRHAKQPISALEELGAPSLDQPVDEDDWAEPTGNLRRALFLPDEERGGDGWNEAEQSPDFEPADEAAPGAIDIAPPADDPDAEIVTPIALPITPQAISPVPANGITAEELINRPLDELGIVQLVERFALSLQKRPASALRDQADTLDAALPAAVFPVPEMVSETVSETMQAVEPVEETSPPVPAELPEALRPVDFTFADGDSDDQPEDDEEFSSLLNLRKSGTGQRKSMDLLEESAGDAGETVAVFPAREVAADRTEFDAPAAVPAANTERTLRDALAQLQKMSGVG